MLHPVSLCPIPASLPQHSDRPGFPNDSPQQRLQLARVVRIEQEPASAILDQLRDTSSTRPEYGHSERERLRHYQTCALVPARGDDERVDTSEERRALDLPHKTHVGVSRKPLEAFRKTLFAGPRDAQIPPVRRQRTCCLKEEVDTLDGIDAAQVTKTKGRIRTRYLLDSHSRKLNRNGYHFPIRVCKKPGFDVPVEDRPADTNNEVNVRRMYALDFGCHAAGDTSTLTGASTLEHTSMNAMESMIMQRVYNWQIEARDFSPHDGRESNQSVRVHDVGRVSLEETSDPGRHPRVPEVDDVPSGLEGAGHAVRPIRPIQVEETYLMDVHAIQLTLSRLAGGRRRNHHDVMADSGKTFGKKLHGALRTTVYARGVHGVHHCDLQRFVPLSMAQHP